jgi:hypothetical protein
MEKVTDYVISKVRYDTPGTKIVSVIQHKVGENNKVGEGIQVSRFQVTEALRSSTYFTIYYLNGAWKLGSKVNHVTAHHRDYVSINANENAKDNLGNLAVL